LAFTSKGKINHFALRSSNSAGDVPNHWTGMVEWSMEWTMEDFEEGARMWANSMQS